MPNTQRRISQLQRVLLPLAAGLLHLAPSNALAYCRASDERSQSGECIEEPSAPLFFWGRPCIAYRFNKDVFRQLAPLTEAQVRGAFKDAFDTWAGVDCGKRHAFHVEQLPGTSESAQSSFSRSEPNEMLILGVPGGQWQTLPDHAPTAVAMTLLWHNRTTGEIYDTDMELNLGAAAFADCTQVSCTKGQLDLQNTVTHEAGHVLGLGHSTVSGSTMEAETRDRVEVQKRSLEPDDEDGYCALNLPGWECARGDCACPAPLAVYSQITNTDSRGGCQLSETSPRRASSMWWWLAALGPLVLARRRARSAAVQR